MTVVLSQGLGARAFAQTMLWSRIYESSRRAIIGQAVVTDKDGNAYTVAMDGDTLKPNEARPGEMYVAKFDGSGNKQWSVNQPAAAVALDERGDLFVVGTSTMPEGDVDFRHADITVLKYAGDGKKLWTRSVGTPFTDYGTGVALDRSGHIYVAGGTQGSFVKKTSRRDDDACLVKLDTEGNVLWTREWGSPGFIDGARGVGVDESGNVYLGGSFGRPLDDQARPGTEPFYSIKLDGNGNEKGKHVVNRDAQTVYNQINDRKGNFYVLGQTLSYAAAPVNEGEIYLAKFNNKWDEEWTRPWNAEGIKKMRALAVDGSGNVYVAGSLEQGKERVSRLVILKYSRDGVLLWQHLQPVSYGDQVNGIAVDPKGNVFLTGTTGGRLGTARDEGKFRVFLLKFSPDPPASFDCLKATTPQERLICQSPRLSALDRAIAKAYEAALSRAKDRGALKAEQSQWRKTVRDAGTTTEQLEASMSARLKELEKRPASP